MDEIAEFYQLEKDSKLIYGAYTYTCMGGTLEVKWGEVSTSFTGEGLKLSTNITNITSIYTQKRGLDNNFNNVSELILRVFLAIQDRKSTLDKALSISLNKFYSVKPSLLIKDNFEYYYNHLQATKESDNA